MLSCSHAQDGGCAHTYQKREVDRAERDNFLLNDIRFVFGLVSAELDQDKKTLQLPLVASYSLMVLTNAVLTNAASPAASVARNT